MTFVQKMACAAVVLASAAAAHATPSGGWTLRVLPTLTENGGSARGVNNRGDIAGTSHVAENYPHPAMWTNGVVSDLLQGNPATGVANAINDRGMIAGTQRSGVMVWDNGAATSLGIAGEPQDITKSGGVVGYYYPSGEIAWGPQEG
ncbi:MAG TPA: hypothetical protein VFD95_02115, partial [Usitatibacter sp.]|nr:hypothetical protein [Usitatibacter sp.]